MIDVENEVFDRISVPAKKAMPELFISSEEVDSPPTFPAVSIQEINNALYEKMMSIELENAVIVSYEVNVYSNKIGYRKQEAKAVINLISNLFKDLGFRRTFCSPVKNMSDKRIYRITARFEAIVDKNFVVYAGR